VGEISRWGDSQQYISAPIVEDERGGPKIILLEATRDPLGAIAAMCRMYEGKPTYQLESISDEERLHYWKQVSASHLGKTPLEAVNFHFFIEGIDRSLTHQMVRQREAAFAQESLRFAVISELDERVDAPPSILDSSRPGRKIIWNRAIQDIGEAYTALVESGVPAEEARGLLPHATKTRLHYLTNLRRLQKVAGDRLCTQAQFHWRLLLVRMMEAIRNYYVSLKVFDRDNDQLLWTGAVLTEHFRPVCYDLGHCPFGAEFDRSCSIRERVEANARIGRPSSEWSEEKDLGLSQEIEPEFMPFVRQDGHDIIPAIRPEEWLLNPAAARK
jgi:flavin-dependent thymidylate synthase